MKTKNGIELELKQSKYIANLKGLKFYFSSQLYLDKFLINAANYTSQENVKIKIKYNLDIDLTEYLLIALYKKIEKRGFYITGSSPLKLDNFTFINKIIVKD